MEISQQISVSVMEVAVLIPVSGRFLTLGTGTGTWLTLVIDGVGEPYGELVGDAMPGCTCRVLWACSIRGEQVSIEPTGSGTSRGRGTGGSEGQICRSWRSTIDRND